ncbi:acyl carrier protein [Streptomyces sp. NPDC021093]|uniref:acyl carrier protein n=1 Tax=Streptomyces sp. NPDC021093 TaxID=3365112 RepID=UPI0037AE88BA
MQAVYDHLVTVLTDKFDVDASSIDPDSSFNALELDSLAVVELLVTLQDHWDVPLEEDTVTGDTTVRQVAEAVGTQLDAGHPAAGHAERT